MSLRTSSGTTEQDHAVRCLLGMGPKPRPLTPPWQKTCSLSAAQVSPFLKAIRNSGGMLQWPLGTRAPSVLFVLYMATGSCSILRRSAIVMSLASVGTRL
jgi:hypothetical protein